MRHRDDTTRAPGAAQHEASRAFTPVFAGYGEVVRCRPGTVMNSEAGTVPDQRCTTTSTFTTPAREDGRLRPYVFDALWCCTASGHET